MIQGGIVVLVAAHGDRVAVMLGQCLHAHGVATLVLEPRHLASVVITLDSQYVRIDGRNVAGILWRAAPRTSLSEGFAQEDQTFADSEAAAAWLAALGRPSLLAINRYSASVWYGGCHWPAWHTWLRRRNIPVSRFCLGAPNGQSDECWMPYLSCRHQTLPDTTAAKAMAIATSTAKPALSAVVAAGEVLHPFPSRTMREAVAVLKENGIALARVTMDDEDRVLAVDAIPDLEHDDGLERAVDRIAEMMYARVRAG